MGARWCPTLQREPVVLGRGPTLTSADVLLQERKVYYCLTKVLGIELTLSTSLGPQKEPFRLGNFSGSSLDGLTALVGAVC